MAIRTVWCSCRWHGLDYCLVQEVGLFAANGMLVQATPN